jgi:hypothetical protein
LSHWVVAEGPMLQVPFILPVKLPPNGGSHPGVSPGAAVSASSSGRRFGMPGASSGRRHGASHGAAAAFQAPSSESEACSRAAAGRARVPAPRVSRLLASGELGRWHALRRPRVAATQARTQPG